MKYIIILGIATILYASPIAQTIGSKVSIVAVDGKTYSGIIKEIQGNKYKVKYEGYDFESWLTDNQFTVVDATLSIPNSQNKGNLKFKVGDRVEVDKAAIDSWEKGTVMPFLKNDWKDGTIFRVRLDSYARNGMYLDGIEIPPQRIRLINAAPYTPEKTAVTVGKATVDADGTLSADRPILQCPIQQSQVTNGARPNAELFKKIIRCNKGEKAAYKGYDGAVTIDVTSLQIGTPRKWQYGRDIGGGPNVIVYPVKSTFSYKTFYRSSTQVSENWISIINFHVNDFGEWTTGSEESIKMGDMKNIIRE